MWEALGLSGEVGVDYVTRYCYFTSSSSPPTGYAQEEQLKEEEEIKEEEGEEEDSGSGAQPQGSNDAGTDEELEMGPEQKGCFSYQNSPGSHLSNQDAENESLLSDASVHPKLPNEAHSCMDKMTAVYANILSDSYWSGLGLGFKLSNSERRNCDTRNGGNKTDFDWHQDALSKSLQQNLPSRSVSKPSLFSSVQLYRQSSKMCGTVFTGASRFRCRQCSAAYDTLVELTVHMNETGHYQDDNRKKDKLRPTSYSKPRKRAFQDMDKEDAQKVLKCMFCGDSFDSLQDLSVHMIKTKHYQKVPLKEPVPTISSKMVTPAKKRVFDVNRPCSPDWVVCRLVSAPEEHQPPTVLQQPLWLPEWCQLHLAVRGLQVPDLEVHGVWELPRHSAAAHHPHDGHRSLSQGHQLRLQERQAAGAGPTGRGEDAVVVRCPKQ